MDNKTNGTNKIIYIEILRIIATFSVILLHTIAPLFANVAIFGTKTWWAVNIVNAVSRFGVPVFFMISGFLALSSPATDDIVDFYRKKLSRILIPFLIWSVIYYVFDAATTNQGLSVQVFLTKLIQMDVYYHLWFAYVIVIMYLFAPFLKKIVDNCTAKQMLFLLLLIVFPSTIRPLINKTFGIWIKCFDPFIEGYAGYFVLGFILARTSTGKKMRFLIYFGGLVSVLVSIIGTYRLSSPTKIDVFFNTGYQFNSYLIAASVFVFCKHHFNEVKRGLQLKTIYLMGKLSFGVYLCHVLVLEKLADLLQITPEYLSVPIYAAATFVLSYSFMYALSKTRYVKKWVM